MISVNISGLEKLQQQLTDAQRALASLDGHIKTVKFDRDDVASVERAIREAEIAVDQKVAPYRDNPIIAKIAEETKDRMRDEIRKRAAESMT